MEIEKLYQKAMDKSLFWAEALTEKKRALVDSATEITKTAFLSGKENFLQLTDETLREIFLSSSSTCILVALLILILGWVFERDSFASWCSIFIGCAMMAILSHGQGIVWEHLLSAKTLPTIIILELFQVAFLLKGMQPNTAKEIKLLHKKMDILLKQR